jgi:hypothetical protein
MVMKKETYRAGWMQMGHPRTIGGPFQAMSSWWMEEPCRGHRRSRNSSHCRRQKQMINKPTDLHSDSQSAIALAIGGHYHVRTKHIDIRYHFIRYIIEAGSIKLIYCPTDQQTADTLTKALPSVKAKHFARAMGLHSD